MYPLTILLMASLLLVGRSTLGQQPPSSEEQEAYAQVDMQLSEPRDDSDIGKQVREVTVGLKKALAMMRQSVPAEESSRSAEVRGATVELMEQLIRLAEMSDLVAFHRLSEQIGNNLLLMEREGDRKLPQLEVYLASLVASKEHYNGAKADARLDNNGQKGSPKKEERRNWFSDLLAKIFS